MSDPDPELERALAEARPAPAAGWRGDLGRALDDERHRRRLRARPAHLYATTAALALGGAALLAFAATLVG
jgi:hypothetical protein